MIQIDREIRDSIIFSRRALEMRFGATAESVDGDLRRTESTPVRLTESSDLDRVHTTACHAVSRERYNLS